MFLHHIAIRRSSCAFTSCHCNQRRTSARNENRVDVVLSLYLSHCPVPDGISSHRITSNCPLALPRGDKHKWLGLSPRSALLKLSLRQTRHELFASEAGVVTIHAVQTCAMACGMRDVGLKVYLTFLSPCVICAMGASIRQLATMRPLGTCNASAYWLCA